LKTTADELRKRKVAVPLIVDDAVHLANSLGGCP
jgi:hypothetical protein